MSKLHERVESPGVLFVKTFYFFANLWVERCGECNYTIKLGVLDSFGVGSSSVGYAFDGIGSLDKLSNSSTNCAFNQSRAKDAKILGELGSSLITRI